MARYRYRTRVLVGPWRNSPEEAREDAVRAGQAEWRGQSRARVRWIVPGSIERRADRDD